MTTIGLPFLLLGLIGTCLAVWTFDDPACNWDCSHSGVSPVCGGNLLSGTGRQQYPNFCTLQRDSCQHPAAVQVPIVFGLCPPFIQPLNCNFPCPKRQSGDDAPSAQCGLNKFGHVREFDNLCELARYNCRNAVDRHQVVECP